MCETGRGIKYRMWGWGGGARMDDANDRRKQWGKSARRIVGETEIGEIFPHFEYNISPWRAHTNSFGKVRGDSYEEFLCVFVRDATSRVSFSLAFRPFFIFLKNFLSRNGSPRRRVSRVCTSYISPQRHFAPHDISRLAVANRPPLPPFLTPCTPLLLLVYVSQFTSSFIRTLSRASIKNFFWKINITPGSLFSFYESFFLVVSLCLALSVFVSRALGRAGRRQEELEK